MGTSFSAKSSSQLATIMHRLLPLLHLLAVSLRLTLADFEDYEGINIYDVEETCPQLRNATVATCPIEDLISPCEADYQCKIGSKCCQPVGCPVSHCMDANDGSVSPPLEVPTRFRRRWKRRVVRCTECACVRSCLTNRDCTRGRRRRCYQNSCSSYCI